MVSTEKTISIAARVGDELDAFLAAERPGIEDEVLPLLDELEALLRAGGKRIRPRFCYWGFVAGGGSGAEDETVRKIVRVGAALELLHTFALIHDDVMDQSPRRRNRISTFRSLAERAADAPHQGDPRRFGSSAAILTGLLGFVLADRLFLTSGFGHDAIARAAERFDRMRTRTIAGQYLDLDAAHRGACDEATARRIATLKSAGYTIADPLVIGTLCATDNPVVTAILDGYGFPLGEAFQIRDDVLGTFGDPSETGKDCDGDLREGKQTVLLAKTRAKAGAADREFIDQVVGNPDLTNEDAERVRSMMASTGALHATNALIDELTARAKAAIDSRVVGDDAAEALRELADEVTERRE